MRNTFGYNMTLLLFYQSTYAIELEQSSFVISLAYRALCLIFHVTYMFRLRSELRWRFAVPLGVPKSYACRSIGLES
jgi:hypothetical protein